MLRSYAMIGAFGIAQTVENTSFPRHDNEKKLVADYLIDSGGNNLLIAQFDVMPVRYMI